MCTLVLLLLALSVQYASAFHFLPFLESRRRQHQHAFLPRTAAATVAISSASSSSSSSSSFSATAAKRRKSGTNQGDPLMPSVGKANRSRAERGRQLENELSRIQAAGARADMDLFQKALRSCAKLGNVSVAMALLRQMQQGPAAADASPPPRLAYNLVLEAAAKAGNREVATSVYHEMLSGDASNDDHDDDKATVGVNVFTYGQLLSLYANLGDGKAALALLEEMAEKGVAGNAFTYTSAIDACERARLVGETDRLLKEMKERGVAPTVVTYNTIIARRAERADTWHEALDWLAKLEASGIQPLRSSYAAALNACERAEEWELVVELTERAGPLADASMWTRHLAALTKLEQYDEVLQSFRALRDEQTVPLDEVLYTLALKACALGRRPFSEAKAFLDEMQATGLAPNVVTFSAAMEACGTDGNWEMGLELLREMKAQHVQPNTVTYSILLDLLTEAGQWQRALHLFMTLEKEEEEAVGTGAVTKSVWLYTAAIRACAKGKQLDTALALLREVTTDPAARGQVNLCLYTAALDACEKVGDGPMALQLLDEMYKEHGIVVDDVACGVAISACRKAGLVGDCLRLLAFMLNHRLGPNLGVYNTVLGALCSQPEYLDKAVEVLTFLAASQRFAGKRKENSSPARAPRPNAQSYSQVVDALADALRWEEALQLLQQMRDSGHRPEVLTCAKVVAACEKKQRWKEALQLLDDMRKAEYSFYELELLDQVFKKLVGVAAAGVRSISGSGAVKGAPIRSEESSVFDVKEEDELPPRSPPSEKDLT